MGIQTLTRYAFQAAKVGGEITFLRSSSILAATSATLSRGEPPDGPLQVEASHCPRETLRLVVEGHQRLQSDAALAQPLWTVPLPTYLNISLVPAVHLNQIQRKSLAKTKVGIFTGMLVCQKFREDPRSGFVNFWCLKVLEPLAFTVCKAREHQDRSSHPRAWPFASKRPTNPISSWVVHPLVLGTCWAPVISCGSSENRTLDMDRCVRNIQQHRATRYWQST